MENRRLKIIVERNIPFMSGLLEPYAEVRYLAAQEITSEAVRDADAIVVRTRTRCDAALLAGSRCKLVVTATIGMDHIDIGWCASHGISVANAPGCNAPAVAQYVFASLESVINRPIGQYSLGVVGAGHVGSIVEQWARSLDMKVLVCDPPREKAEGGDGWSSLEDIARQCDIITFHTPLTRNGEDATWHLADGRFFASLDRAPIVVNSARGPIVDTAAMVSALDCGLVGAAVIDCWEGEPEISRDLLRRAAIATPHIAGYSYEGKVRATRMALDALSSFFGFPKIAMAVEAPCGIPCEVKPLAVLDSYDPHADSEALKASPGSFEKLRDGYDYRHEVTGCRID